MLLRVALLDDDPGTRPVEHIFLGQRPAWCDWDADGIARYQGWGPEGEPKNPSEKSMLRFSPGSTTTANRHVGHVMAQPRVVAY